VGAAGHRVQVLSDPASWDPLDAAVRPVGARVRDDGGRMSRGNVARRGGRLESRSIESLEKWLAGSVEQTVVANVRAGSIDEALRLQGSR